MNASAVRRWQRAPIRALSWRRPESAAACEICNGARFSPRPATSLFAWPYTTIWGAVDLWSDEVQLDRRHGWQPGRELGPVPSAPLKHPLLNCGGGAYQLARERPPRRGE